MKIGEIIQIVVIGSALLGGGAVIVSKLSATSPKSFTVAVNVPDLSAAAINGERAYTSNCAECHGVDASGTEKGPPLIHKIYNPGHHGDEAFYRAAKYGVKQHHWPYGDMPPRPNATRNDVASIIAYIREVQRANGIFYQEHRM